LEHYHWITSLWNVGQTSGHAVFQFGLRTVCAEVEKWWSLAVLAAACVRMVRALVCGPHLPDLGRQRTADNGPLPRHVSHKQHYQKISLVTKDCEQLDLLFKAVYHDKTLPGTALDLASGMAANGLHALHLQLQPSFAARSFNHSQTSHRQTLHYVGNNRCDSRSYHTHLHKSHSPAPRYWVLG
jgi:hypothetical protein